MTFQNVRNISADLIFTDKVTSGAKDVNTAGYVLVDMGNKPPLSGRRPVSVLRLWHP